MNLLLTIAAVICGIVIAFLIYSTIQSFRLGRMKTPDFIFWLTMWVAAAVIIFIPKIFDPLSEKINIKPINLALYAAILVAFWILYSLEKKMDKQDENLATLKKYLLEEEPEVVIDENIQVKETEVKEEKENE